MNETFVEWNTIRRRKNLIKVLCLPFFLGIILQICGLLLHWFKQNKILKAKPEKFKNLVTFRSPILCDLFCDVDLSRVSKRHLWMSWVCFMEINSSLTVQRRSRNESRDDLQGGHRTLHFGNRCFERLSNSAWATLTVLEREGTDNQSRSRPFRQYNGHRVTSLDFPIGGKLRTKCSVRVFLTLKVWMTRIIVPVERVT